MYYTGIHQYKDDVTVESVLGLPPDLGLPKTSDS